LDVGIDVWVIVGIVDLNIVGNSEGYIVGIDVGSDTFDDGISVGNIEGKIDGIMVG